MCFLESKNINLDAQKNWMKKIIFSWRKLIFQLFVDQKNVGCKKYFWVEKFSGSEIFFDPKNVRSKNRKIFFKKSQNFLVFFKTIFLQDEKIFFVRIFFEDMSRHLLSLALCMMPSLEFVRRV